MVQGIFSFIKGYWSLGGEDPDPRHALRSFVQEFGLSLADARRDSSEAKLMPLTCALTCYKPPPGTLFYLQF